MKHFTVDVLKMRLDKYLAQQLAPVSRSQIQRAIESGAVVVNDQAVTEPHRAVRMGDEIKYQEAIIQKQQKPTNITIKTLYNNHGLLVIDKPPGLAVHPGAGLKGDSLS